MRRVDSSGTKVAAPARAGLDQCGPNMRGCVARRHCVDPTNLKFALPAEGKVMTSRLVAASLAIIAALLLAACGRKEPEARAKAKAAVEEAAKKTAEAPVQPAPTVAALEP